MSIRDLTSDEINNIIAGKTKAVLGLYRILNSYLENWFQYKVSDEKDREELVADTILSVIDSLPNFKKESGFGTWVLSIAHHELVDYYRRRKIKSILFSAFPFLENLADMALGPQLALEEKEAKMKIYHTFKKLSEGNAAILRLKYLEGLSVSDIAQKMGISYKAAESKLTRARLAFAKTYVSKRPDLQEAG